MISLNPIAQAQSIIRNRIAQQFDSSSNDEILEKGFFTEERLNQFKDDIKKSLDTGECDLEYFEKAMKDVSHLEKKIITNKLGQQQTVYVRHHTDGQKHEFQHGDTVTFEHKGKQVTGKVHALKHHEVFDKFGTAHIKDEQGNMYSKSLRNLTHHKDNDVLSDKVISNSDKTKLIGMRDMIDKEKKEGMGRPTPTSKVKSSINTYNQWEKLSNTELNKIRVGLSKEFDKTDDSEDRKSILDDIKKIDSLKINNKTSSSDTANTKEISEDNEATENTTKKPVVAMVSHSARQKPEDKQPKRQVVEEPEDDEETIQREKQDKKNRFELDGLKAKLDSYKVHLARNTFPHGKFDSMQEFHEDVDYIKSKIKDLHSNIK